ncbi:MAG TPA: permease, partial [Leucothrix sp.]|nr:permease [Leucothrix sp.]
LFGAPLPLCSCGVIPAALGLRRAGASKASTVSFLVSTPETGIDSVSISYALLGPFMAIVRPVAAVASAIVAGLLVGRSAENVVNENAIGKIDDCCLSKKEEAVETCCSRTKNKPEESSCCGTKPKPVASSCCSKSKPKEKPATYLQTAWNDVTETFTDLFDKVLFWLIIGLIFAALVKTFVPITFLAEWGSGLPAMLIMLLVGIPMYVCATSSTPIAAGLLLAGVSPGTAMVYLMAGPASNISTLGIIGKELGKRALVAYLLGVAVVAIITGFVVDYLVEYFDINIQTQIQNSHEIVPSVIAWAALILLIAVALKVMSCKAPTP